MMHTIITPDTTTITDTIKPTITARCDDFFSFPPSVDLPSPSSSPPSSRPSLVSSLLCSDDSCDDNEEDEEDDSGVEEVEEEEERESEDEEEEKEEKEEEDDEGTSIYTPFITAERELFTGALSDVLPYTQNEFFPSTSVPFQLSHITSLSA